MRILIDILHPAHVHFFRNFYDEMSERGHELCITARDKDCSVDLLEQYGLPYQQISVQKSGTLGMVSELTAAHGQPPQGDAALPAGRDDRDHGAVDRARRRGEDACRQSSSTTPSSRGRRTGSSTRWPTAWSRRTATTARSAATTVQYAGYHELAYLHPDRFQPDPERLARVRHRSR